MSMALAGNKYGWMVEIDPRRSGDPGIKHTALGRFRHEAVAVRAGPASPWWCTPAAIATAATSTASSVRGGQGSDRSAQFRAVGGGRLEVARFSADGSGRWIPLDPSTPAEPACPRLRGPWPVGTHPGAPHRPSPGRRCPLPADAAVEAYCKRHPASPPVSRRGRGATRCDPDRCPPGRQCRGCHPAARPEDTMSIRQRGDLLVAFTAGGPDGGRRSDPAIFHGPGGEAAGPMA